MAFFGRSAGVLIFRRRLWQCGLVVALFENPESVNVLGSVADARGLHLLSEALERLLNVRLLVGIASQLDKRPLAINRRPPRPKQELDQSVGVHPPLPNHLSPAEDRHRHTLDRTAVSLVLKAIRTFVDGSRPLFSEHRVARPQLVKPLPRQPRRANCVRRRPTRSKKAQEFASDPTR